MFGCFCDGKIERSSEGRMATTLQIIFSFFVPPTRLNQTFAEMFVVVVLGLLMQTPPFVLCEAIQIVKAHSHPSAS